MSRPGDGDCHVNGMQQEFHRPHDRQVSSTFRTSPGATPATQVVSGTYRLQGSSLTFT